MVSLSYNKKEAKIMNITHDMHLHTGLSLCASPDTRFEDFIEPALEMGLEKIGISNHFWDENVAPFSDDGYFTIQNFKYLEREADAIRKEKRIKVSFGCEAEYDYKCGDVAMTEETAEKFDHILVSHSHTHLIMPSELKDDIYRHMEFMMKAYSDIIKGRISKYITAVAHPFDAICTSQEKIWAMYRTAKDSDLGKLFDEAAKRGIAYELNVGGYCAMVQSDFECSPNLYVARLAKRSGCKFTFGSDAHSAKAFPHYKNNALLLADILELTDDDIAAV